MNIEIRTDKNIPNSDRLITYVRAELNEEFQRHSERITHFSVHLSDENGDKGGSDDIKCMIEARPAGLKPVVVNHRGHNVDTAIHGAIDRLKRSLEHLFEKKENPRSTQPAFADADAGDQLDDE
ncbi:HPF/RaiA family ribosome-associated protein [Acinetobacter gandensis]|uniref:Ribosomal subunit interface protein n=1 Tax=Acinetobacter gandensis TaxID=1443941 RepID=A0A1A7RHN1_9GAMM|nr:MULTISPECIES: HPF/RaiA family ribosome-associated protein [Acinetobacter]KAB0628459.1 HPF/RaiA family ribosome-associated protein [Acinetobacter gandensis]OBX30127.1 ribosomal subunit interface protein [Acinetobacter gandensis]